ncbi:hypothetical protein GCK72_008354 [Caenorhabditis remanei]|uniref:Uncharacterized protein n=1 Tax=Caenorhabditis remanei TaxID=31234 RepID=A0A6A5GXC1_CAERE|nr:hypothetical protein GCK72_008354 [Caenorhabditis remanei]KAF1760108.1 hypothetical protein GCK72_008354 [Caenorhabditis remanei]
MKEEEQEHPVGFELKDKLEAAFDSINDSASYSEFGGFRYEKVKYDESTIQYMLDASESVVMDETLGLDPVNEVHRLIQAFPSRDRIVSDLQMRFSTANMKTVLRNGPQAHLHFAKVADKRFAPRHPFDLPVFYYHFCHPERSLTNATHNRDQEFQFGINCMYNTNPTIRLFNGLLEMYDHAMEKIELPHPKFGKNIYYKADQTIADTYSKPGQHSEVIIHGMRIFFEDGTIKNDKGYRMEVFLNNREVEANEKIQKVEFFLADENTIEVMTLFKKSMMAGGFIRKKKKVEKIEQTVLIVSLDEITGTYGTSDFQCSPNFKSMLRTSRMGPKRRPRNTKQEVKIKMDENREIMKPSVDRVKVFLGVDKNNKKLRHKRAGLGHQICTSLCKLKNALQLLKDESAFPSESEFWTAGEKVVYALYMAQTDAYLCEDTCVPFLNAVQMCSTFVDHADEFEIQGELLLMFSYQLMSMLFAIEKYIHQIDRNDNRSKREIHIGTFLPFYYIVPFAVLKDAFINAKRPMKGMLLEIICRRATPSVYSEVLDLYQHDKQLVEDALKSYPHIMLFGHFPASPCADLVNDLGVYLDNSLLLEPNKWVLDIPRPRVLLSVKPEPEEIPEECPDDGYVQGNGINGDTSYECGIVHEQPVEEHMSIAYWEAEHSSSVENHTNGASNEPEEFDFVAPMKPIKKEPLTEAVDEPTTPPRTLPSRKSPVPSTSADNGYYRNAQGFERKRKQPFDWRDMISESRDSTPVKTPGRPVKAPCGATFTPNRLLNTPYGKYRKLIPPEPTKRTFLEKDPTKVGLLDKIWEGSSAAVIRRSVSDA